MTDLQNEKPVLLRVEGLKPTSSSLTRCWKQ